MASTSGSLGARIQLAEPASLADRLTGTPIVVAAFASGAEFLDCYSDDGEAGELALVTRARPRGRGELVLEIAWPGLPNPVFVRARVAARRLGLVARLHPDEVAARDYLLRAAREEPQAVHLRRHRRYCVRVPLEWRAFGNLDMQEGVAADLSAGGMLITTCAEAPAVGEQVSLRMRTAGLDLVVTGAVRHRRRRSVDSAFGVEFSCRSGAEQRQLRGLLRLFAARGVVILEQT
jgi:PilZ domain